MSQNSIGTILRNGKRILKECGIESYSTDAQVLLMHTLNITKIELFLKNENLVALEQEKSYYNYIDIRKTGKPLAYIVGFKEFMSLDFKVTEETLIPRGDTEILIETILEMTRKYDIRHILDIGTGTGCIPLSLMYYNKDIRAMATDICKETLDVAQENAIRLNLADRCTFVQSDLFSELPDDLKGGFDAIISNPPYISQEEMKTVSREVKEFEPYRALYGGEDGLAFYRRIISSGQDYIRNNGWLFFEIGYEQAESVMNIMKEHNMKNIVCIKDLAGLDRVVFGQKTEQINI